MFERGTLVVIAVSGGPDSICLLHTMARLRRLFALDLACFHFDHGLRSDSERDAVYVRRQAASLRVPCHLRRADSKPGRGESVEAWARGVRYRALNDVLEELGGGVAAVGHTADDQAETLLLAVLRGGGLEALAGMRPVSRPIVRPLLEVPRKETVAFCRALRLRPRRDPMNEDPRFLRAAIRTRVVPELERRVDRGVGVALARTASLLRRDADFLDRLAREAGREVVQTQTAGSALVRATLLSGLPWPIASRVIRRLLRDLGSPVEAAHVEATLDLAAGPSGRSVSLPGGLRAVREGGYLRVFRPSPGTRVLSSGSA
jgi:tRNA(Ile)-lysidine synthase